MGVTDRAFHRAITIVIREAMTDPEIAGDRRERVATLARTLADALKRSDAGFSHEWFYGACGLDHWGDVIDGG